MIIADLQECIGTVSKKADIRVNLARSFSATKKSSKKTPKVSQKATKNRYKSSFVLASSNPHSEQQVRPSVVTLDSNDGAVMSSNSTATTIPLNVLERYLQSSTSLVMSPPTAPIMPTLPNSNISENNSISSVSYSTFGQSTTNSNTSVSKVDERANQGNKKSLSESGKEDPVVKKRK